MFDKYISSDYETKLILTKKIIFFVKDWPGFNTFYYFKKFQTTYFINGPAFQQKISIQKSFKGVSLSNFD